MSKLIRTFAFATIAIAAVSGQAFAHAHLKTSTPADKSSVPSPSALDLTFSEELNLKFSGITLTGPDKKTVELGDAMLMEGDKAMMVPVAGKLVPGSYKLDWHALSADGHKTNGSLTFTVKP